MEAETELRGRLERYVDDIHTGRLESCRTIRLAIERYLRDLENPDLFLDYSVLVTFDKFSREFKHYKGPLSGQRFSMADWQIFVATNILCLKYKRTGLRKYRLADIEIPRKNGKTFFVAILGLFLFLLDGESGPEVYTAAVDQAQARLCYDAAENLVMRSIFRPLVKKYNWGMTAPGTVGVFKPLSKETENKDGLNIFGAICDEVHAWPNTKMMDVIETGTGARSQPVIVRISTAGIDTSVPYYRDIEAFINELEGIIPIEEDHFFFLYTPDKGDNWEDEKVWKKLNPNLGVSLTWDYMRSVYNKAKIRGGSAAFAFQTKNLNMWVDAPEVWISDDDVAACSAPIDLAALRGQPCYVGVDMASKSDITATAFFFPRQMAALFLFCLPEDKIRERTDLVDYRAWRERGWITTFPGKTLDEDWWLSTVMDRMADYDIKAICYDPWGMWDLKGRFGRYQEKLMEYRQDIRYMSVPTKRLEADVLRHAITFGDNPVIRWMFRNVVVYRDPNANIKLDKARSRNKIDGVVALVDAIGGWLNQEGQRKKVIYSSHSLRTV